MVKLKREIGSNGLVSDISGSDIKLAEPFIQMDDLSLKLDEVVDMKEILVGNDEKYEKNRDS